MNTETYKEAIRYVAPVSDHNIKLEQWTVHKSKQRGRKSTGLAARCSFWSYDARLDLRRNR